MGVVAFEWNERGNNQLLLMMNRDNWYSRAIREVAWNDSEEYLSGHCEANPTLFWLGVSKKGRVAFLVSSTLMLDQIDGIRGPDRYPDVFLRDHTSPQEFAENLVLDEHTDEGHVFSLIVADVNCPSMIHIRKPDADESNFIVERVPSGIHSLSINGLDEGSPRDFRLRDHFERMICNMGNYGATTTLLEIPGFFMYDAQGDDAPFLRTVGSTLRDYQHVGIVNGTHGGTHLEGHVL
ncbi:PREDICTED: uncharacterized protein LOC104740807 isoform X2 [Camelina sativa]|uniref:Uncharacterized protein LOC104740807 isoform X2 n=1 Tax=Camelina sativa TaxID=90675 RepID=A0ABM0VQW2_CAMSA|nr:PREDICTED: uncharacterized protein LOC104740807 isoform X2 [Camelina sativa]